MKTVTTIIFSAVMGLGLYAMYDATMKERAAKAEHAKRSEQCQQIKVMILSEFDALAARDKFPSHEQQDEWAQLLMGCIDE